MKKMIGRFNVANFEKFVGMLRRKKEKFEIVTTGYTRTIIWNEKKFSTVASDSQGGNFVFACFSRLKKDIENSNIVIDNVPEFMIRYFGVCEFIRRINYDLPSECFNVDISSAYLSVLFNHKMISGETYNYIQRADKPTRLKAVGMLATNRMIFTFEEGKMKTYRRETDFVLRNFFFFCCFIVGEMMQEISNHYGEDFLFFWVDGIYLRPSGDPRFAREYLREKGYSNTLQTLENVSFETRKKSLYFAYTPVGKEKPKHFRVPYNNEENRKRLQNYLTKLKNESNPIGTP